MKFMEVLLNVDLQTVNALTLCSLFFIIVCCNFRKTTYKSWLGLEIFSTGGSGLH